MIDQDARLRAFDSLYGSGIWPALKEHLEARKKSLVIKIMKNTTADDKLKGAYEEIDSFINAVENARQARDYAT